jgi:hypothetical protein
MPWAIVSSLFFLIACGSSPDNKEQPHNIPLSQLQAKRDIYVSLLERQRYEAGFISNDCDAVLFNALVATAVDGIDVGAAQDSDGRWYRRASQDCFRNGESASSTSRDMLMGVLWWGLETEAITELVATWTYGIDNQWVMGEGDISRVILTAGLQATLAEIIFVLGGDDHSFFRKLPQLWPPGLDGYQAHLQSLHIALRGRIPTLGGISDTMLKRVVEHRERSPNNAFFQFVEHRFTDGDQQEAINILLNENWFPADRLPNASDRCEPWLWQRDQDDIGWQPCGTPVVHHGGDLIFLTKLIEDALEMN